MKKIFFAFCMLFTTVASYAQIKNENEWLKTQKLGLKNYAFCSCISYLDSSKLRELIEDGSVTGYFEITNYSLKAYHQIDSLAKKFALKHYSSIHNKPLGLMKCLDFYNSTELRVLINALEKELHYPK